ncbi:MAG: carboxypeptidase-like regulatory domain-containing protein [Bacteroidales bacterium]
MGQLYCPKLKLATSEIKPTFPKRFFSVLAVFILCTSFLLLFARPVFAQASLLDKTISIPRQHTTLYTALNLISQRADCLFIYDSQIVENDKKVKLYAEKQPIRQVLDNILLNPELSYKVIGEHILIYRLAKDSTSKGQKQNEILTADSIKTILIKGFVFDNDNKTAIPFVSIGIVEENIGTITNEDGFFAFKVPANFSGASLVVSHLGYTGQRIPIKLLNEQKVDIFLNRRVISLQEVIIRYIDPSVLVRKALEQRKTNYSHQPVYTTSFYREGVQKNKKYISYSEAVFKVYKSPIGYTENSDQVKVLKSRKILNQELNDTVYLKLKGGILSALQLDIVKCVPGFLDQTPPIEYTFKYSDLVSYNETSAYAVTFVQNKEIKDALYKGTLFIDKETFAILGADFEINPEFLDKAAENLIVKKSHKLIVKLEKINYSISYTPFNGKYYLNHIRCDIQLKTRARNHLSGDNFHTFLELATCHIDTANVVKFPRQEVLKPNIVFSDEPYSADNAFWETYNIITPEAKLSEALSKIIGKIEEIE